MNNPPLAESGVHLNFNHSVLLKSTKEEKELVFRKNLDNNVAILKLFPGITSLVVKSFLSIPNLKGIVLETYGSGNAPTEKWFIDLLEETVSNGVYIVNVTQCTGGSVILGHYETSSDLKRIGIVDGKNITTETAVAKMMYLLGEKLSKKQFKYYFETSLRGEIN